MSRRNFLPAAGASAPLLNPEQRHVAVGLPELMTRSVDYVLRLDPDEAYVHPNRLIRLGYAAQERASHFMIERPFDDTLGLDTSYARSYNEYVYAQRLSDLDWEAVEDAEDFGMSAQLILSGSRTLLPGRMPELRSGGSRHEVSYYVPIVQRRWESRMRNKHGYFIPYHMREATVLRPECFSAKYLRCPSWWKRYEVPYWFAVETPWCVTYRCVSRVASYDEEHPFWSLFLTEYTQNVLFELMYAARSGRLPRLSPALLDCITKLGVRELLPAESLATWQDAEALLRFVKSIRWASVPAGNRSLPGAIGPFLTVYVDSGDWVAFDPIAWKPVNPPGGLLEEGQSRPALGAEAPVGNAGHLPEEGYPQGRNVGTGAAIAGGRAPGREVRQESRRAARLHDIAMVRMVEALKLKDALRANGVRGMPTLYAVARLLKDLLVEGKAPVVVAGEEEEEMEIEAPVGGDAGGQASGAGDAGAGGSGRN